MAAFTSPFTSRTLFMWQRRMRPRGRVIKRVCKRLKLPQQVVGELFCPPQLVEKQPVVGETGSHKTELWGFLHRAGMELWGLSHVKYEKNGLTCGGLFW
jgi:hypothetical protein